jgi:SAM-dependent methyltransferase
MGLGPLFLKDFIALKRRGLLEGYRHIVEIGAQQINDRLIASPELDEIIALFGGTKPALTPVGAPRIRPSSPPGRMLWTALGFHSQSLDIEDGEICIDLNDGAVPEQYRGAFDIAINAGTTEHIANQGNAFAAIHDLVRVGGLMYHQVPASGNIDHGFFGYQPKFFHRLAHANEYEMVYFAMKGYGEFEPPEYLRERSRNLPEKILSTHLHLAMVRKPSGKFVMPADK